MQVAAQRAPTERAVDSTVGAGSSPELDMAPLNVVTFLGDKTKRTFNVVIVTKIFKMPADGGGNFG